MRELAARMREVGLVLDLIVATGAIRPAQWLCLHHATDGQVLYVADEDLQLAREIWPDVPVAEIDNKLHRSVVPCAN